MLCALLATAVHQPARLRSERGATHQGGESRPPGLQVTKAWSAGHCHAQLICTHSAGCSKLPPRDLHSLTLLSRPLGRWLSCSAELAYFGGWTPQIPRHAMDSVLALHATTVHSWVHPHTSAHEHSRMHVPPWPGCPQVSRYTQVVCLRGAQVRDEGDHTPHSFCATSSTHGLAAVENGRAER